MRKAGESLDGFRFNSPRHRKILLLVFIIFLVFNSLFYFRQRSEWMGEDNTHLTAKEYFVSGQVLFGYRIILADYFHPEKWWLSPMAFLQKLIYQQGLRYLPTGDGERYFWKYSWFVYPYARQLWIAKDTSAYTGKDQIAPQMVHLLDRTWSCLQGMAMLPFADKKIYENQYLKNYPTLAHYWAYMNAYYTGEKLGARRKISRRLDLILRMEKLVGWLAQLEKDWGNSAEIQPFLKRNPKVKVIRYVSLAMLYYDIFSSRIWSGNFDCDDPYLIQLVDNRNEFFKGIAGQQPAWRKMTNKLEAKRFYYILINSKIARFSKYVLNSRCGYTLDGDVDMEYYQGRYLPPAEAEIENVKNLFNEEVKLLEGDEND